MWIVIYRDLPSLPVIVVYFIATTKKVSFEPDTPVDLIEPDKPEDPEEEEPDDNNDVPDLDDAVKSDNWLISLLKIIWNFIKSLFGIK